MDTKKILLLSLSICCIIATHAYSADENKNGAAPYAVSVIELHEIQPVNTYFTGKVETIESNSIAFGPIGDPSRIKEIKKPGDILIGPIYNEDGSVYREGTIVAELEADKQKADLKKAEYALKNAYDEVERNEKLIKANSVSKKEYNDSVITLMTAKADLNKAKYQLSCTRITAPYSGVVVEDIKGHGMAVGSDAEVVKVARMDPILVKVPLTNELVDLINKNDPVYVYPAESRTSVVGWAESSPIIKNTLFVYLHNEIVPINPVEDNQKNIRMAYLLAPVISFYERSFVAKLSVAKTNKQDDPDILSVPEESLHHDDKGDYVFKASGQVAFKDRGSAEAFTVEKVYIKKGSLRKNFNMGTYCSFTLVNLDDPGSLKHDDVIVVYGDENIKSGDKVLYTKAEWLFYPGEEVMVKIPAIVPKGFYVPKQAIIHETEWSNFVFIVDGNKAKMVEVDIAGVADNNFAIKSVDKNITLKDGTKVIILNDSNDAYKFYDGMPVTIKGTCLPDERLQHPHTDPLHHSYDDIKFF